MTSVVLYVSSGRHFACGIRNPKDLTRLLLQVVIGIRDKSLLFIRSGIIQVPFEEGELITMKQCKKCGAVQNDDRTTCIDCGALLGGPMTEEEEYLAETELDDRLDGLAERTQDFYVPLRDKIIGVLCIIGAVAAILLLNFVGVEKAKIKADIPDNGMVSYSNGVYITMTGDGSPGRVYPTARSRTLDKAGDYALIALISFIGSGPMLFFPQFMWKLDTLKYRVFYNWDTTPSYFAIVMRKALTYGLSVIGMGSILYGYYLYL